MAWDDRNDKTRYQAVVQEQIRGMSDRCISRADDSGTWNTFKAWYPFLIHLVACVLLFAGMTHWINDQHFKTGSPPTLFKSSLYQTQITGLISLALVLIRMLAGSCSVLLVWRTIFILLEKRGITLTELTRLGNFHVPIIPRGGSRIELLWSCWAMVVIFLLWPPSFAAPLANSSVAWIPSKRLSDTQTSVSLGAVGRFADWAALGYEDRRMKIVINAALMAGKDPAYAFDSFKLPHRRYFSSIQKIPANSTINLTVPYFDVNLRWIDAASDNRSVHVNKPEYTDVALLGSAIRDNGTVAVIRNEKWDSGEAAPQAAATFSGTKLVSIKVGGLGVHDQLPDGSTPKQTSPCPTMSAVFGKLPDVGQQTTSYFWSDRNGAWEANDCFLMAEASITAGNLKGTDCTVSSAGDIDYMATCIATADRGAVKDDWMSGLTLDFMSEVMKYVVMLNLTQPWMHDNPENYTIGMLTLAYHATWSALMKALGNASEPTTTRIAESVVRATVDRTKICTWLAMSAMLTTSAFLVAVAQKLSMTKGVRDTTLAAVTMDLTEVTHSGLVNGLCSAVALNKGDHKLPKLKWTDDYNRGRNDTCRRRVVNAESDINAHGCPPFQLNIQERR